MELKAFIEEKGQRRPFCLKISEPYETTGEQDYYCRVHAPELLKEDKDIFGVDKEQARLLALEFVKSLLSDKRLVDEKGQSITL